MGLTGLVMAADPFQVSVRTDPTTLHPSLKELRGASDGSVLSVQVEVPAHHKLYADQFRVEVPTPASLIPRYLPAPEKQTDPLSGENKLVFTRSFKAFYAIENLNTNRLPVTVRWQGCNETICFLPVTKTFLVAWADGAPFSGAVSDAPPADVGPFAKLSDKTATTKRGPPTIKTNDYFLTGGTRFVASADWRALTNLFVLVAQRSGYLSPSELLSFLESAQGQGGAAPEGPLDRWLQRSLWLSILILLVGGLALNLTPCVLPMIPVNLAIIGAGTGAQSRRHGFGLGALYGLGMAVAYGILGLLVVLTGSKFGAINASPWFNVSIAVLFAVLALAMFDVYAIDFSRFQGRFNTIGMGGGVLVIVALGALAAILSGACVAPVVLSVLLLSASLYAQGHGAALLLPFILGLGMALPWPLAGAGLAWLPKPGRWMERIKHGFGVLILLAAVYYAYTGLTIWWQQSQWRQHPRIGAREGWLTSLPEALSQADREKKPVFIDFWASWCKNCHAMDATTFRNAQVRQQLEAFIRLKVQAEHPNQPPDRDILDAFTVMGLPTYVILKPNR